MFRGYVVSPFAVGVGCSLRTRCLGPGAGSTLHYADSAEQLARQAEVAGDGRIRLSQPEQVSVGLGHVTERVLLVITTKRGFGHVHGQFREGRNAFDHRLHGYIQFCR